MLPRALLCMLCVYNVDTLVVNKEGITILQVKHNVTASATSRLMF